MNFSSLLKPLSLAFALIATPAAAASSSPTEDLAEKKSAAIAKTLSEEMPAEGYREFFALLKKAIDKEFPEFEGRIAIADTTLGHKEAKQKVIEELGLQNEPAFAQKLDKLIPDEDSYGIAVGYIGANDKYYCAAFGGSPAAKKRSRVVVMHHIAHEAVGHCLDPEVETVTRNGDSDLEAVRIRRESYAETVAGAVLYLNGAYLGLDIADDSTIYAKRYGTVNYDIYQTYESLAALARLLPDSDYYTYDGSINRLREATQLARRAIEIGGYSVGETIARASIEKGWSRIFNEEFAGNENGYRQWMVQYQKLPEVERLLRAHIYTKKKLEHPFPDWDKPDYVRAYAQLLVYKAETKEPKLDRLLDVYEKLAEYGENNPEHKLFSAAVLKEMRDDPAYAASVAAGGPLVPQGQRSVPAAAPPPP